MTKYILFILQYCAISSAWYSCSFNDGSFKKTLLDNVTIQAECMYLTSPLDWHQWNPNIFDGFYYNTSRTIPVTNLHMKRLFLSILPPTYSTDIRHIIHYWLVNGGGGSQYGMEVFGLSILKEIVLKHHHETFPHTRPIIYLFQYRGAGLCQPSIHCHTATTWLDCAQEVIQTTVPSSVNESLSIIHAMSNHNIAQDLQYQIQYSLNQSQLIAPTSIYIYGLSQGTAIIQYYLTLQSIKSQIQTIDGIILDGVMSTKKSDAFQNQIRSLNDRFYMYLSKCQTDLQCLKAFQTVTGTDQDIISVALTLKMWFQINMTNPYCTSQIGLTDWQIFNLITSQSIETIVILPLAAILIARIWRCSPEDQRVLARGIPIMITLAEQAISSPFVDPPSAYPNDGSVLSIITIWSDFVGFTLEENFKSNSNYYNDFCINGSVTNEFYLSPTGPMPLCRETQMSKYNYTLPTYFQDFLYEKDPQYWGQFQINRQSFRTVESGALLLNGDLDYNSPMASAQLTQNLFDSQRISTRLVEMKGLTHVTSIQSYTKQDGFQSNTCTDIIIAQFLYQQELHLNLNTLDTRCSQADQLIGIDWFYQNSLVNQTLYEVFGNSTIDYWGIS